MTHRACRLIPLAALRAQCCFDKRPDEAKEQRWGMICQAAQDGNNGQMFVAEELRCKALDDKTLLSQMAADLANERGRDRRRAAARCASFVEAMKQSQPTFEWPDFRSDSFD